GERDRDQAPLAAREPAELPSEQALEPESLAEHARVERPRVVAPDELDHLRDTKRRWKRGLLGRDADASPRRRASRVETEQARRAGSEGEPRRADHERHERARRQELAEERPAPDHLLVRSAEAEEELTADRRRRRPRTREAGPTPRGSDEESEAGGGAERHGQ